MDFLNKIWGSPMIWLKNKKSGMNQANVRNELTLTNQK